MKLMNLYMLIIGLIFSSCEEKVTRVTESKDEYHTRPFSEIVQGNKKVSEAELKEMLYGIGSNDFSQFSSLSEDERIALLKLLINQIPENMDVTDDLYRVLTGLQAACFPPKKEDWQRWLNQEPANKIFWTF